MANKRALVEDGGLKFPCPLHRYAKTKKVYDSDDNRWKIYCAVCGHIGRL